jgi:predicted small integral membrane protein
MKWWWRASAFVACTAIVFGGLFAWRAHRNKLAELGQLSELRVLAERGDAVAQDKLAIGTTMEKECPKI